MKECEHFVLEDALIDETEFCALNFKKCKDITGCYYKQLAIANKTVELLLDDLKEHLLMSKEEILKDITQQAIKELEGKE